jgi:hypothetical protein
VSCRLPLAHEEEKISSFGAAPQSLELLITVKDEFIHVSVTETNGAGIALIQPHFSAAPLNV